MYILYSFRRTVIFSFFFSIRFAELFIFFAAVPTAEWLISKLQCKQHECEKNRITCLIRIRKPAIKTLNAHKSSSPWRRSVLFSLRAIVESRLRISIFRTPFHCNFLPQFMILLKDRKSNGNGTIKTSWAAANQLEELEKSVIWSN